MLGRENIKPIISQVAMIESKFEKQESYKKVHLPATLFNRSPQRPIPGYGNASRALTPTRIQNKIASPLKFKRDDTPKRVSNYFSQPQMQPTNRRDSKSKMSLLTSGSNCVNTIHGLKSATFVINEEEERTLYC